MMTTMMMMSIVTSMTFMFMKHPMSMGLTLLIQSLFTSLCTGLLFNNFWYSYIIFLIMIGGMLVLFIYMTTVASNEKFKYSNKVSIMIMMLFLLMLLMSVTDQTNWIVNLSINEMMMFNNKSSFNMSLNKFMNMPSNAILTTMIIYLFISLIAVVKITNIKYGPLRQKL